MKAHRLFLILLLTLTANWGCLSIEPHEGDASEKIVGGESEVRYPAVGAMLVDGQPFCTGTMVTPTVVVTAGHCVHGIEASTMEWFIGPNANDRASGRAIRVASAQPHPLYSESTLQNDIAVLVLSEPADVEAMPMLREAMDASWVGRRALFVGYGITRGGGDDAGEKRSVTIPITNVGRTDFRYSAPGVNTCNGDSGGPALIEIGGVWTLIGVTSWGDEACNEFGVNTRVDTYLDFIAPFIEGGVVPTPEDDEPGPEPLWPEDEEPLGPGDDPCEVFDLYGNGICDFGCPYPDPDCEEDGDGGWGSDPCEEMGLYGNGTCDPGCPYLDPDCDDAGWGEDDWADPCEEMGLYGNGICDPGCLYIDPDCEEGGDDGWGDDPCEEMGLYGNGICDYGCLYIDPDCEEGGDDGWDDGWGEDPCEEMGLYGNGTCDPGCPYVDPDCDDGGGMGGDPCDEFGLYGDGFCDVECFYPDPDCDEGWDW